MNPPAEPASRWKRNTIKGLDKTQHVKHIFHFRSSSWFSSMTFSNAGSRLILKMLALSCFAMFTKVLNCRVPAQPVADADHQPACARVLSSVFLVAPKRIDKSLTTRSIFPWNMRGFWQSFPWTKPLKSLIYFDRSTRTTQLVFTPSEGWG